MGKICTGKPEDFSIIKRMASGESKGGLVLGITHTRVKPPENAALAPVANVSLSSLPGSRK